MNRNILRQLKDIQHQANKLLNGSPELVDIENFSNYADEINRYLMEYCRIEEVVMLTAQIPKIYDKSNISNKNWLLSLMPNIFSYWFYERNQIEEALEIIEFVRGKYASIEFILKNNF